jgi:hypothetical protein
MEVRVHIHLPRPIERYFRSDGTGDTDALATCFVANATVVDEGRTYEGLAAITAWRIEAKDRYHYTVEPLEALQRDGRTLVTAKVAGDFAGSPVTLEYVFALERDKIVFLEIHT